MTDDTKQTELLPCPFCGKGTVYIEPDYDHSKAVMLRHHSDGCIIDNLCDWHLDIQQAIAAWNTRQPTPSLSEAVALQRAAAEMDLAAHIMSHHGSITEQKAYQNAAKAIRNLIPDTQTALAERERAAQKGPNQ